MCSVDLACLNWILYSYQCNGCNVYWHYINTVTACDCPLFQILPSLSVTGVMLVAVILCNDNSFWSCVCFFFTSLWKFDSCWTKRRTMLLDKETYHAVGQRDVPCCRTKRRTMLLDKETYHAVGQRDVPCCWTKRRTMRYPCGIPTVKLMKSYFLTSQILVLQILCQRNR